MSIRHWWRQLSMHSRLGWAGRKLRAFVRKPPPPVQMGVCVFALGVREICLTGCKSDHEKHREVWLWKEIRCSCRINDEKLEIKPYGCLCHRFILAAEYSIGKVLYCMCNTSAVGRYTIGVCGINTSSWFSQRSPKGVRFSISSYPWKKYTDFLPYVCIILALKFLYRHVLKIIQMSNDMRNTVRHWDSSRRKYYTWPGP